MTARLPHRTFSDTLSLRLENLRLDGIPRPDVLEGHLARIDLTGVAAGWDELEVDAFVEAPPGELAEFVADGLDITCTVVVSCVGSFLRRGFVAQIDPGADGRWTGRVSLDPEEIHGKADVVGQLSADIAHRPARRLGRTAVWALYADETARPPFQGTFQVRWSHFTGPDKEPTVPAEAASESFFLDLTSDTPAIHLNRDLDGLPELLEGDDRRPDLERALRDAEMQRIATAAWTSAIGTAAASIRVDQQTGEHELPQSGWRAEVLRWSLPSIFPGSTLEESLKRIRNDLVGEQAAVTQALIQLTVSRRMKAGDLLKRALRTTAPA